MRIRRFTVLMLLLAMSAALLPFRGTIRLVLRGGKTVQQRLAQYGPSARGRLRASFRRAGVAYPPRQLVLAGFKTEQELQVYAAGKDGRLRFIRRYPILAASGVAGPKLREGDGQVPEGLYRVDWLNPNSAYHLSLHVTYPNAFDRRMAKRDKRTKLGGDIMIHGSDCSIGCLAMGDQAAEDLFVLAADTGLPHVRVILTPVDFRHKDAGGALPTEPAWVTTLYRDLKTAVCALPSPPKP